MNGTTTPHAPERSAGLGRSQMRSYLPPGPRGGGGPMGFGMPVEKPKNFSGTLARLARYLAPSRLPISMVFAAAVVAALLSIFIPRLLGKATTLVVEGILGTPREVDFKAVRGILGRLLLIYTSVAGLNYLQLYVMAAVAQRTVRDLRRDLRAKLDRLPLKYFDGRTHGEILSRATNDVDVLSGTLQQNLTQLVSAVISIIGAFIMMLVISPVLTLVALGTLPFSILITMQVAKRSRRHFKDQQDTLGELNGKVEEAFSGHIVVKAFGRERETVRAFNVTNRRLYESSLKAQFISGLIMPLMHLVNNLGYALVCVIGGIFATRRTMEIGDIQAFIQYLRQFTQPIVQTANLANIIQSAVAAAERVFELLDEKEEVPDVIGARLPPPKGAVCFEHVAFSYKPGTPLIEDMNFDVEPGQLVAIVGPTGAGKTTLVNLLLRFYEIQGGRISFDGRDIRTLAKTELRGLFGMVLQDTWLFNGTIRDNIAYGREGADFDAIVEAAKTAHADHFIRTLPDGYGTVLNEEASNISQGQKQLITIARAVLADPPVLILDEATSSVDTRTEQYIQKAMITLMSRRTSFVIAHRLSTIRDADLILVMNEGHLVEQGTHDSLVAQGGFYAELYDSRN